MDTIDTIRYDSPVFRAQVEPLARRGFAGRMAVVFRSLARQVSHMLERRRGRLALMEMTDEQLKDIGVSRCDAHREGIRPFWE
ncbi:DUF1127 domain-containing protein [Mesorhizobium sp. B2-6-2]|uniref:DUF1127 domain-containing protein n=1 Tax=Mesorhizobium sp. B2-6-2 TaxID=2589915 RepID=UPI0011277AD2|nr:DUF1127 domain-containing protein [Mesorhizobium sp. B2-6-2]TPJ77261.1 DUF1127 domain-containing protein [Mesorhizobium sp. B2-6-2]